MAQHAPEVMNPDLFSDKVKLHKKKGKFTIRGRTVHPLREIHSTLTSYHRLHKSQLQQRHHLLDLLVRRCNNYIRGKDPTKTGSEKVQTVAILAWQANQRLMVEQKRAKEFAREMNTHPAKGAHIHSGLKFERVAKPGQLNATGGDLLNAAQQGAFGVQLQITGNDEIDFYAMKKLLKTLTPEQLRLAGLKALEYASDTQRARYAVDIDDNVIRWNHDGSLVHTLDHITGEVPGFAHYAMSLDGKLYIRKVDVGEMGRFAHSSFLAGSAVLCAGTISVDRGRIIEITNESGHYQPSARNLSEACKALLEEGYYPGMDGYALLTDFAGELQPMGRYGRYRVPIEIFAESHGSPAFHLNFEVERQSNGRHRYVDEKAAASRGCAAVPPGSWVAAGCLYNTPNCAGPRFHPHMHLGLTVCPQCRDHAQAARLRSSETDRIAAIRTLAQSNLSVGRKQASVSDMAAQTVVDLLWEAGIDQGTQSQFAFLMCGSIARGESSTYSDIDAVLVLAPGASRARYEAVMTRMDELLWKSGLKDTGFRFCQGGLSPLDSINNPALLGTSDYIIDMINDQLATGGEGAVHLLGALHTKLIYGDRNLANNYQMLCSQQVDMQAAKRKAQAVREIGEFAQRMKTGEWKVPTGNELYIQVKNQIYRPVHMIVHSLAQYYGIGAVSSRDQLVALRDQRHMTPEIANMLGQVLDVAGQLRMELQLQMGREYEALKLRAPTNTDPAKDVQDLANQQVATANQLQKVRAVIPYLRILAGLASAFAANKSKKGLRSRENPFTTANPMTYQI